LCPVATQEQAKPAGSRIAFADAVADDRADGHSSDSSEDDGAKSGNESGAEDDPDQATYSTINTQKQSHATLQLAAG
jgi:hypothetical protein